MTRSRKAQIKTIKTKNGNLYMATLGGKGYYYPTKSKAQAKSQVMGLRRAEKLHTKGKRKK
jgi:hypothetical protein